MQEHVNEQAIEAVKVFTHDFELPDCIVLDSAYGSMGRMVGYTACDKTPFTYYDAALLLDLVPECGLTNDDVVNWEQKLRKKSIPEEAVRNDPDYQRLNDAFLKAVRIALSRGPCLIHDRVTKEEVEALGYKCLSVITYSNDMEAKINKTRLSPIYSHLADDVKELRRVINEEDNIRINWHNARSETFWGDLSTYDLCINTDQFGIDYSAEILKKLMEK